MSTLVKDITIGANNLYTQSVYSIEKSGTIIYSVSKSMV